MVGRTSKVVLCSCGGLCDMTVKGTRRKFLERYEVCYYFVMKCSLFIFSYWGLLALEYMIYDTFVVLDRTL